MIALFSYRVYLGVRYVVFFCRYLLGDRAFADSIEYKFPVAIVLVLSSLIRLRMATADCFVEYVVFIHIIQIECTKEKHMNVHEN